MYSFPTSKKEKQSKTLKISQRLKLTLFFSTHAIKKHSKAS